MKPAPTDVIRSLAGQCFANLPDAQDLFEAAVVKWDETPEKQAAMPCSLQVKFHSDFACANAH
jgi:hypothetical protein